MAEHSSITELLSQRQKLLAFVRSRVQEPVVAEDILQDSLLKALRAEGDLDAQERLIPWFYRILNNAIVDYYRHRAVEARHVDSSTDSFDAASPLHEDEGKLCECFRALIPALKPEYSELIERLELANQDVAQVAQELGTNTNNLKVRRHRARQALRQLLEQSCRVCAKHGCLDCTCSAK